MTRGPRENGHRPAIDPLFRSAARSYGPRVIGVLLSGNLDDGTAGLLAIKARGGLAVVQDPREALYAGMPLSAVENVAVDHVLPVAEIPPLLVRLAHQPVAENLAGPVPEELEREVAVAENDNDQALQSPALGQPSVYTCPECHGTLWEVQEGKLVRFRCRAGHAYSSDSLLAEQSEALEEALWTAFRALKESEALARKLADRAERAGQPMLAARFRAQAQSAAERAALIRDVLQQGQIAAQVLPAHNEGPKPPDQAPAPGQATEPTSPSPAS